MAVNLDRDGLKAAISGLTDDTEADRLLAVCRVLVDDYAPDAPADIANEAVIRCAGWIRQSAIRLGELKTEQRSTGVHPLRASGSRAMLSAWHQRIPA